MSKAYWDIVTAHTCKLPEIIPDVCGTCRDQAYCHNKDNFPCETCFYDINGCCDYDEPLGRYCVLGSAYKPKLPQQISIFEILGKEK